MEQGEAIAAEVGHVVVHLQGVADALPLFTIETVTEGGLVGTIAEVAVHAEVNSLFSFFRSSSAGLQGKNSQLKVLSAEFEKSDVCVDVDFATALKYLRGEALVLPSDTPRGIVTVTYQGQPLGPAKNIGNRANNLYPKPWRIKSTHLPSEAPKILHF